jgi:hypothetical protein
MLIARKDDGVLISSNQLCPGRALLLVVDALLAWLTCENDNETMTAG